VDTETGYLLDPVGSARFATSELVNACKALPDFDTFQIVYGRGPMYNEADLSVKKRRQALRESVEGARNLAINRLKEPGAGRNKTTVRVIELVMSHGQKIRLDPVKVEEYKV
jgi:hypothetical protein